MRWWVGAGLAGWVVAAAAGGVIFGRAIREAEHLRRHYLDDPGAPPPGYVTSGPPIPPLPDDVEPSLAGAILAVGYATDERSARYWLDVCAQRGADWTLQRQLWDAWQHEHARNITRLHTDNEDDL